MPQITEVAGQARWPLRSFTTWTGMEGPRAGSCGRAGEGQQPSALVLLRDHGKGREEPDAAAQGPGRHVGRGR